ncbi:unnamed protein product [Mortierella alpina]
MTRILLSAPRQGSTPAPEWTQLQTTMANLCSPYNHIIVLARTSPRFGDGASSASDGGPGNPSTRRQRELLRQALALVPNNKLNYLELSDRSAYGDDIMGDVSGAITNLQGTVLVVTTMVDRLVRNKKHLPTLNNILIQNGGQIASILWDPLHFKTQASSPIAKAWQTRYPPLPAHALSPPILVPDLWFDRSTAAWSSNVLAHVKAAQDFCEGFRKTMRQGAMNRPIPEELMTTWIARGFNPARAHQWATQPVSMPLLQVSGSAGPKLSLQSAIDV